MVYRLSKLKKNHQYKVKILIVFTVGNSNPNLLSSIIELTIAYTLI